MFKFLKKKIHYHDAEVENNIILENDKRILCSFMIELVLKENVDFIKLISGYLRTIEFFVNT